MRCHSPILTYGGSYAYALSGAAIVMLASQQRQARKNSRSGALSVRRTEGAPIPLYLAFKNLFPFVVRHLGDVHIKPLKYRTLTGGAAQSMDQPDAPWCAVVLHPSLSAYRGDVEWMGDFERCIAWAWITRRPALQSVK